MVEADYQIAAESSQRHIGVEFHLGLGIGARCVHRRHVITFVDELSGSGKELVDLVPILAACRRSGTVVSAFCGADIDGQFLRNRQI